MDFPLIAVLALLAIGGGVVYTLMRKGDTKPGVGSGGIGKTDPTSKPK